MINYFGITHSPSPNPEDKYAGRLTRKADFKGPSSISLLLTLSIISGETLTFSTLQNLPAPFVPAGKKKKKKRGGGRGRGEEFGAGNFQKG